MLPSPFMTQAISLARQAAQQQEVPVGAVLVYEDTILAQAHNEVMERNDVTAHGEILVIQRASLALGQRILEKCDLYVTLEPCPMCAHAISLAHIRRLYFGAYDPKGGGIDHGPRIYHNASCHHRPEVYGGISETVCSRLLQDFFAGKR